MHLLPADLRREHPRGQRTWHGHSLARCQLLQASERLLLPCCSLRMLMRCACTALHASTLVDFRSCSFSGRVRCRLALPLVCRRTARGATSCSWTGPYTTREMKQVLDTPPHGEPLDGRRGVQAPGASEHRSSSQVGTLAGAHSLSSRQRQEPAGATQRMSGTRAQCCAASAAPARRRGSSAGGSICGSSAQPTTLSSWRTARGKGTARGAIAREERSAGTILDPSSIVLPPSRTRCAQARSP